LHADLWLHFYLSLFFLSFFFFACFCLFLLFVLSFIVCFFIYCFFFLGFVFVSDFLRVFYFLFFISVIKHQGEDSSISFLFLVVSFCCCLILLFFMVFFFPFLGGIGFFKSFYFCFLIYLIYWTSVACRPMTSLFFIYF